jgi:hypothetical protein
MAAMGHSAPMSHLLDHQVAEAVQLLTSIHAERPVLRRRDLLAEGINDALQSAMVRRGSLVRLRHGVYVSAQALAAATPSDRHRIHVAAAVSAATEPTWAFGLSAVSLRGLPLPFAAPEQVHLLRRRPQDLRALRRPSRHPLTIPEVAVHGAAVLDVDIDGDVRGVPCLSRAAAAVTASPALSHRWRVALFDAVRWGGMATEDELEAVAGRWRHLGQVVGIARAIADSRDGAQTVLETFSRLALVRHGLPEPELQVAFHDAAGLIGFVDMWWPHLRVIGEADGAVKYESRDDLMREKAREDRLRGLGHVVVRWTWREIQDAPESVAARIRAAARRVA